MKLHNSLGCAAEICIRVSGNWYKFYTATTQRKIFGSVFGATCKLKVTPIALHPPTKLKVRYLGNYPLNHLATFTKIDYHVLIFALPVRKSK